MTFFYGGNSVSDPLVIVRKNSTTADITRPRINFIEGANVLIDVQDSTFTDEVNITISASDIAQSMIAAGSDKFIQFNKNGVLSGSAGLAWDYSTNRLLIQGIPGTSGNNVESLYGVKIGNNFASAINAGAGSLRWTGAQVQYSELA